MRRARCGAVVDFEFSPDQEMLRDSVRRFLSDRAPLSYVRSVYDTTPTAPDDVWSGLCELGVVGLLVPEQFGGAGMGMVDAAVVLEELGRAVCPAPFASSAVGAVSLVLAAGSEREHAFLLPGLADGSIVGTIAVFEPEQGYSWDAPECTAVLVDGEWSVSGEKVHVADGCAAGLVLVTARDADGAFGVFAVQAGADGVSTVPMPTVDGSRKSASVVLRDAKGWRLGGVDADDAAARAALERTLDRLGVAGAVDGVGAAQRALELAIEYAKERVQFGRPIGSFQAVQHLCADMLRTVELGRAASYYACWAADDAAPAEAHRAAVMAQAFAADSFGALGGTAIQVFGGIGFTWEHDVHLFYKRLLTVGVAFGTADDHLTELASIAID